MTTNATQRTEREAVLEAAHLHGAAVFRGIGDMEDARRRLEAALDAYGQARELRGHFGACVEPTGGDYKHMQACSPEHPCGQAKAIMEEAE